MNHFIIITIVILFLASGCENPLPKETLINETYKLIDQDSNEVIFPHHFKNKIVVAGFIFTNCPDICPMTIHNMQLIQQKAFEENINNIEFAAISFDPLRDTPSVLKMQAEVREVDLSNFSFLTGNKKEIDSLLYEMNFNAFTGDTTYTESGIPVYFFVHTDRITLIDQQGRIRKEYTGSRIEIDEILTDIKFLGE